MKAGTIRKDGANLLRPSKSAVEITKSLMGTTVAGNAGAIKAASDATEKQLRRVTRPRP